MLFILSSWFVFSILQVIICFFHRRFSTIKIVSSNRLALRRYQGPQPRQILCDCTARSQQRGIIDLKLHTWYELRRRRNVTAVTFSCASLPAFFGKLFSARPCLCCSGTPFMLIPCLGSMVDCCMFKVSLNADWSTQVPAFRASTTSMEQDRVAFGIQVAVLKMGGRGRWGRGGGRGLSLEHLQLSVTGQYFLYFQQNCGVCRVNATIYHRVRKFKEHLIITMNTINILTFPDRVLSWRGED